MRLGKDAKVELIRKVPLFSKLSKKELQEIAQLADEIDLPEGKVLTRQGAPGREFVVLLDGSADVDKDGKHVNSLGKGDFFGEIALVTKQPRTATVTLTSPARALVITERDFSMLLKHSPDIGRGILEALAERLAPELS
jgi:CPA1 family monovalent cation:H+ antiporter